MQDKIINGSFKGVQIAISEASLSGGRKHTIKQFPNRDTQSVEDLGAQPRKYSLQIIVGKKGGEDYFAYRNSLIAVLESKGSGVLIHPLYGRVEDVVAVSYSINEMFSSFGDSTISVNFELDGNLGIPQVVTTAITQVSGAKDLTLNSILGDLASDFVVTSGFAGNFAAATDSIKQISSKLTGASSFITDLNPLGKVADFATGGASIVNGFLPSEIINTNFLGSQLNQYIAEIDPVAEFASKIDDFANNANSLATNPAEFAKQTLDVNKSMMEKFESGSEKLQAARNMFNYP